MSRSSREGREAFSHVVQLDQWPVFLRPWKSISDHVTTPVTHVGHSVLHSLCWVKEEAHRAEAGQLKGLCCFAHLSSFSGRLIRKARSGLSIKSLVCPEGGSREKCIRRRWNDLVLGVRGWKADGAQRRGKNSEIKQFERRYLVRGRWGWSLLL